MHPSRGRRFTLHSLIVATALFVIGCGASSNGTPGSITTAGGGGTNTPGMPGVSNPNPSSEQQWSATVSSATNGNLGTITVSTAGDVNVSLTGAQASTGFTLQFCQFPQADFTTQLRDSCFAVAAINTDANGAVQTTVPFPQRGIFAGHFFFSTGVGQVTGEVSTERSALTGNFTAQLVPMSTANGGIMAEATSSQEPFTSGTVVASQQRFTLSLAGAVANRDFNISECATSDTATCLNVATFTTDSTGGANISASVDPASGGSIFRVIGTLQPAGGFISGFTIP